MTGVLIFRTDRAFNVLARESGLVRMTALLALSRTACSPSTSVRLRCTTGSALFHIPYAHCVVETPTRL